MKKLTLLAAIFLALASNCLASFDFYNDSEETVYLEITATTVWHYHWVLGNGDADSEPSIQTFVVAVSPHSGVSGYDSSTSGSEIVYDSNGDPWDMMEWTVTTTLSI